MIFKVLTVLYLIHSVQSKCKSGNKTCQEIKTANPDSTSGYYNVIGEGGDTENIYCNFDEICGNCDGWKRVGYLNSTEPCPETFKEWRNDDAGVRYCGRKSSGASCDSVTFPTGGSYSQVCGRVRAYQSQSTDGIHGIVGYHGINEPYVDGISITHGSPRTHIFTLISGVSEVYRQDCPCGTGGSYVTVPSFVGDDYYCESGNPTNGYYRHYLDDILWDGEQCNGYDEGCCDEPYMPYFHKVTGDTSDPIEMRICLDQNLEDFRIIEYEFYVQ